MRPSRAFVSRLSFAALVIALAACPGNVHVRIERPYPPPTAAELRAALVARQQAVKTINAEARATSWLGGERVRATVLMLVDRIGRLRLEAQVSLQGTVAVLVTDGQRFALFDARKNEFRRGPACPGNIASVIRIPLGPADVAAIFLGDAKLPAGDDGGASDAVDWDGDVGGDVLVVGGKNGASRYLFQRKGAVPSVLVGMTAVDRQGHPIWHVAFDDFAGVAPAAGVPPVLLPQIIRYAEGARPFDEGVEIKFKERAVNETFTPDVFTLATPPGATALEVGCP
ncbi:MAG TPA: hypothetical protein VGP07_04700 [Polyangia bacterium]|jgi:hypothetical protein